MSVYRESLAVLAVCDEIQKHLPRGQANTRSQIERASTSIVANTAEGAGEVRPAEKARLYRIAKRSGVELAAWLEIVEQRKHAPTHLVVQALATLETVVRMLVGLIKTHERPAS